eukprot:4333982-Amphidinium_carterae.1
MSEMRSTPYTNLCSFPRFVGPLSVLNLDSLGCQPEILILLLVRSWREFRESLAECPFGAVPFNFVVLAGRYHQDRCTYSPAA